MGSGSAVVEQFKLEAIALDEMSGEVDFGTNLEGLRPFATDRRDHRGFESHTVAPELERLFEIADTNADVVWIDRHGSPSDVLPVWPRLSVGLAR